VHADRDRQADTLTCPGSQARDSAPSYGALFYS
jgi:hypothetical protein